MTVEELLYFFAKVKLSRYRSIPNAIADNLMLPVDKFRGSGPSSSSDKNGKTVYNIYHEQLKNKSGHDLDKESVREVEEKLDLLDLTPYRKRKF